MRRPRWQRDGREPDYRFSLANERTLLAWIRTALSLLAGGVFLVQFATKLQPHAAVVTLAVLLAALSAVLCGVAYHRWKGNEIAMRSAAALPSTIAIPGLAVTTLLIAAVIASLLLFS